MVLLFTALFALGSCNTVKGPQDQPGLAEAGKVMSGQPKREAKYLKPMKSFTHSVGLVAPMDREKCRHRRHHPQQFSSQSGKTGFGPNLFDEWRYLDQRSQPRPGPRASPQAQPDFVLNQPRYQGANILLARKNRLRVEPRTRPWALDQYGLGAPSLRPACRHLLQQLLQERPAAHHAARSHRGPAVQRGTRLPRLSAFTIDLERQVIVQGNGGGGEEIVSTSRHFRKYCLLNGFDDIGLTLRHADKIKAFNPTLGTENPIAPRIYCAQLATIGRGQDHREAMCSDPT